MFLYIHQTPPLANVFLFQTLLQLILFQGNRYTQSSYIRHHSGNRTNTTLYRYLLWFLFFQQHALLSTFAQAAITYGQHLSISCCSTPSITYRWCSTQKLTSAKGFCFVFISSFPKFDPGRPGVSSPGSPRGREQISIRGCPARLSRYPEPGARSSPALVSYKPAGSNSQVSVRRKPAWASALTCKQRLWKSKVVSLSPLKQTSSAVCFGRFADVSAEQEWISCLFLQSSWSPTELSCHLEAPEQASRHIWVWAPLQRAFLSHSPSPLTLSSPSRSNSEPATYQRMRVRRLCGARAWKSIAPKKKVRQS